MAVSSLRAGLTPWGPSARALTFGIPPNLPGPSPPLPWALAEGLTPVALGSSPLSSLVCLGLVTRVRQV